MVIIKPFDLIPLFEANRASYETGGPRLVRFSVKKYQTGQFKNYSPSMALPDWLLGNDQNYRIEMLWHGDFGQWPFISAIPQTRSSLGNTQPRFDNWRGWLTAVMTDQLGEKETRGLQSQANINQALFMIDWYSIRYINSSIDKISKLIGSDFPYAPYSIFRTIKTIKYVFRYANIFEPQIFDDFHSNLW